MKLRRLSLLPWVLALVLALTGGTMAAARGQMMQGDAVVICSGYGVVTIHVGAQGDPVGTVHPCPDCTLHLVSDLPRVVPTPQRPATRAEAVLPSPAWHVTRRHRGFAQSRAPPWA